MIALLVILLILAVVGFYFYNIHVFETVRICVGRGVDTEYSCEVIQDCIDAANITSVDLSSAPNFLREKFYEVVDKTVYCDQTCFVREIRGINPETRGIELLDSCEEGEAEIVTEIRGKEGLEIMKYLKTLQEN